METLLQLLGVAALSVFELWAAAPAGVALGLPPILVWLATATGAILCIVVVVLAGERLRTWLVSRLGGAVRRRAGECGGSGRGMG